MTAIESGAGACVVPSAAAPSWQFSVVARTPSEPLDHEDAPVDDVQDSEGHREQDARHAVDQDGLLPTPRVSLGAGKSVTHTTHTLTGLAMVRVAAWAPPERRWVCKRPIYGVRARCLKRHSLRKAKRRIIYMHMQTWLMTGL